MGNPGHLQRLFLSQAALTLEEVSVHGPALLPSCPTGVLCLLRAVPGPVVGAGGTGGACRLMVWGRGQTAVVQSDECKEEVRQLP